METLLPTVDLIKKSFDVYLKKIWTLVGLVLFCFTGILALLPFGLIALLISWGPFSQSNFNINIILIDILLALIGIFLAVLFGLWAQVATFFAVKEDGLNFKKALAIAWPKIGPFFWVSLLAGFAVLGGFILFIIPGIIFSIWFCLSVFVFISEDLRGTAALKRSKQLVQGYWWPIFGRLFLIGILISLISSIKFFGPLINIFFMSPFAIVYEYLIYQDLKRIKG